MKKITKLLAIAAGLISLTFISCKTQIIDATIANKDNVSSDETQKTLTLIATSRDKVVTFKNGNSRLIAPAALDGDDLWFYLMTKKISGGVLELIKSPGQNDGVVSFTAYTDSTTEGSVNVTLDVENYELVLFAVEKNGEPKAPAFDEAKAVLKATAYADLRYNESVKFFLMPISSSGQGDVKLSIYTDGWDLATAYQGYKANVYITKDLLTDNDTGALQKTENMTIPTSKPAAFNFPATSTKTPAGTYNFIIDFTNGEKHFYYTDRIVVLANQVTEQDIILKDNIIDKPAEAPTDFYIGYRTPDKDDNDLSYLAEFAWKRNSNNEQYFKIEMLDVTEVVDSGANSSDPHTYVDYIKAITTETKIGDTLEDDWDLLDGLLPDTKKHTFDNTVYSIFDTSVADGITYYEDATKPGRLSKGSELLGLNIPLGRRYLARICACNAAGDSAYAYAKINGGETAGDSGSSIFTYTDVSEWPADAVAMNVFKITYNLVGGNFYDATYTSNVITLTDPTTTVTSQIKTSAPTKPIKISQYSVNSRGDAIIQYGCQSTTATNTVILNPLKVTYPTDKNAALYKGSNVWASWKENSTTAAENFRATTTVDEVLAPYTFAAAGTPPETKIYGTKNLNLYAAYSSATAKIYNVADYAIKEADIKMCKSDKDTYGAAGATEAEITNGATVSTKDAGYIYILVKNNSKYATVLAELKQTDGTKVGTYESTQTTINEADVDNTYEVFRIVTTALQTRNFQLTLEAYDGIPSKSPYTYPINFTITD